MARSKQIFALDLGTTKFCLAALHQSAGRPDIQVCEVPALGMKRGMLVDFEEASRALNKLVEEAEARFKCDIRRVVVGVAGSHLKSRTVTGNMEIQDSLIKTIHVQSLTVDVENQCRSSHREILHCIPIHFDVDSRDSVNNPIGLSGSHLSGSFFVIDADRSYLKDMIRLCNHCGLEVCQLYSEPFASASVTVDDQLKNLGVALADIGGGTTDGIIFQHGRPVSMFTINTAGNHMHRDLSVGLNIPLSDGLRIKEHYGLTDLPGFLDLKDIHGTLVRFSDQRIRGILEARILELGKFMFHSLVDHQGNLGGGILFTGGGSYLKGIDKFLGAKFGVSVKSQQPHISLGMSHDWEYPATYATVIGLINLEIGRRKILHDESSASWPKRYVYQFVNWIRELS
ncbi:cell division protein FtsA [Pseudobacteriovorax antillogorgiicola]|uniref:Cell division protein FtsA n=1 Tax=Pseudobacteriovorax antillogorgiicola TaxID=1513793 RepID=A0A1Y6B478_9BACT|nr:cell division protein FtsA [Pseudobacteriovorax antillogorgiicola]TCS59163.1 cell division protein FtsA [Pseudobacteriovorax antillogorgiicola]SME91076.1 cell division protein FtsA [Pseudobacteriovorax antillogorgiicola]